MTATLGALALRGARFGRRLLSLRYASDLAGQERARTSSGLEPGGGRSDFEILQAARRRQLEWADDFRRVGDLSSAMMAMVDATAIEAELRADDPGRDQA